MNKKDIITLINKDEWMMDVLKAARKLNFPNWWIGAGFIRSKVWDNLHNYKVRTPIPDVDVIYFDKTDFSSEEAVAETTKKETEYENLLNKIMPGVEWSVTNQARMHLFHNHEAYKTSEEGLSHWVETATCIGVKLNDKDNLILIAPHGINDLVNLILRPTINTSENIKKFNERISGKKWLAKWPRLKVVLST
jgi:hypothetical protein